MELIFFWGGESANIIFRRKNAAPWRNFECVGLLNNPTHLVHSHKFIHKIITAFEILVNTANAGLSIPTRTVDGAFLYNPQIYIYDLKII